MVRELPPYVVREREARAKRIAFYAEVIAEAEAFIARMEAGYFADHKAP